MAKGLSYYSFRERYRINRIIRPVRDRYGSIEYADIRANRATLAESVSLIERAVEAKPDDWVCWYTLGDLYDALGEFVRSVKAAEKCYDLRPRDPRSAYALATSLRRLTHAKYAGETRQTEARRTLQAQLPVEAYAAAFDPDESQQALVELGMTLEQAAERSLILFEEVLSLGVRGDDAMQVRDCLAAMYSEFPHLEHRVKSTRVHPKGLLAEARGDPFNQAVEHYQKLRYLGKQPDRLKAELLEVIRLSQAALAKDRRNGDALVLLSNALLLAAYQARSVSEEGYDYLLTRAGAVIHHWNCGRSHTRNRDLGKLVLEGIKTQIQEAKALTDIELERRMDVLRKTVLPEALDPDSLHTIQTMLGPDKAP